MRLAWLADVPQPEMQLRPEAPLYEGDRVVASCRAEANPRVVQYRCAAAAAEMLIVAFERCGGLAYECLRGARRWTLGSGSGSVERTAAASDARDADGARSQFVFERLNHTHDRALLKCEAMNAVGRNSSALALDVRCMYDKVLVLYSFSYPIALSSVPFRSVSAQCPPGRLETTRHSLHSTVQ